MLSRTADHLYWLARYMERAENLARILDVNYRMSLLPQADLYMEQQWSAILNLMGVLDSYRERFGNQVDTEKALHFLVFDRESPSSIMSCLRSARENAHAIRGTLTSELWETTNVTWLRMRELTPDKFTANGPNELFEWVKFRSHLARGVTMGTMLRDDTLHFMMLGAYLERADNTARILDVKYHLLLEGAGKDEAADYYQWGAVLRSVSAFEIYRRVYRDAITPARVAELLILRQDMPRSLACCMREVYLILGAIANQRSRETHRRAGEMQASLRFGRIEDVLERGLHDYLSAFLDRTFELGARIADDFLVPMS